MHVTFIFHVISYDKWMFHLEIAWNFDGCLCQVDHKDGVPPKSSPLKFAATFFCAYEWIGKVDFPSISASRPWVQFREQLMMFLSISNMNLVHSRRFDHEELRLEELLGTGSTAEVQFSDVFWGMCNQSGTIEPLIFFEILWLILIKYLWLMCWWSGGL